MESGMWQNMEQDNSKSDQLTAGYGPLELLFCQVGSPVVRFDDNGSSAG